MMIEYPLALSRLKRYNYLEVIGPAGLTYSYIRRVAKSNVGEVDFNVMGVQSVL